MTELLDKYGRPMMPPKSSGKSKMINIRRFVPRFGLGTFLGAVTVFAVSMALLGKPLQRAREQRHAVDGIYAAGGNVIYDYQHDCSNPLPTEPAPEWVRNVLGNDLFQRVAVVELRSMNLTSQAFQQLKTFRDYWHLDLGGSVVDDSAWREVLGQKHLEELHLSGASITSQKLEELRNFSNLERLHLQGVLVSEDAALAIGSLPNLRELTLYDVGISDRALRCFGRLEALQRLVLHHELKQSSISDKGFAFLQNLQSLEDLDLSGVPITDAALVHINSSGSLRELDLSGTLITDNAFDDLLRIMRPGNDSILSGTVDYRDRTIIHPFGCWNTLNLRYTRLSHDTIERLRDSLPQIEVTHE